MHACCHCKKKTAIDIVYIFGAPNYGYLMLNACLECSSCFKLGLLAVIAMLANGVVVPKITSRASDRRSQHSSSRFVGRVP